MSLWPTAARATWSASEPADVVPLPGSDARLKLPLANRRGFDTVVILTAWSLWKERNRRVFDGVSKTMRQVAVVAAEEAHLWRLARADP
uniref:Uncharacterized protein n=1 Tax=Leersia perrieri TaxID=77586 RepID=A0A0D9WV18_9ORYZ